MEPFFATICVRLSEPLTSEGRIVVGYYLMVGVNAKSEKEAIQMIQKSISDGKIDMARIEWNDIKAVDPAVFDKFTNAPGIWFRSEKSYFPK